MVRVQRQRVVRRVAEQLPAARRASSRESRSRPCSAIRRAASACRRWADHRSTRSSWPCSPHDSRATSRRVPSLWADSGAGSQDSSSPPISAAQRVERDATTPGPARSPRSSPIAQQSAGDQDQDQGPADHRPNRIVPQVDVADARSDSRASPRAVGRRPRALERRPARGQSLQTGCGPVPGRPRSARARRTGPGGRGAAASRRRSWSAWVAASTRPVNSVGVSEGFRGTPDRAAALSTATHARSTASVGFAVTLSSSIADVSPARITGASGRTSSGSSSGFDRRRISAAEPLRDPAPDPDADQGDQQRNDDHQRPGQPRGRLSAQPGSGRLSAEWGRIDRRRRQRHLFQARTPQAPAIGDRPRSAGGGRQHGEQTGQQHQRQHRPGESRPRHDAPFRVRV